MNSNSVAAAPSISMTQLSERLGPLYDSCDALLGIDEYSHDRILTAFQETLKMAARLDKMGMLSPDEHSDCLAMNMYLTDAICLLMGVRDRLADRVNSQFRPWVKWTNIIEK